MSDLVLGSFLVSLMPVPLGLAWRLLASVGARLTGPGASADEEVFWGPGVANAGAPTPGA